MPINAGAVGIQPVAPQRQTGAPESIQRRDGGASSGFQMQTNVALKTAIEDLAATLSKISSQEKYGVDKLPTDIGQLVRNILRQSLSMNETLMQGIGSTIESQRFSTDQLSILARMLSQIGALAEKGFSMELSDETKTLLTQFKNLIVSENGGSALEPVLMTKSAFELVDSKNAEDLPRALYEILAQLSQSPSMPITQPNQSEGMQFLKQLVQYFMPRPSAEESSNRGQMQQPAQMQQQTRRPTATQQLLNSMYRQFDDPYAQLDKQQLQSRQTPDLQSFSRTPDTQNQGQPQQSQQVASKSDGFSPVQVANSQNSPVQNQPQPQQMASNQQSQQAAPKSDTFSPVQGANSQNQPIQNQQQSPQMASNQQSQQAAPKSDTFSPVQVENNQNSPVQNQPQSPQMASNQQSQQAAPKSDAFSPVQGANSQNSPVQNQSQTQQMASNQQSQQVAQNSNDFSRVGVENSQKPQTAPNQQTHSKTVEDGGFSIERERKTQQPFDEDFLSKQQELKEQMLFAKTLMLRQPIQNTPQTMDALKNLAQFLMRSPSSESMTPRESTMLQNFVNNSQTMFSREEARHLQNLLRLCQQNVPTVVQQAAVQQKLPDLPRLWAFMQLCDMAGVNSNMTARAFKKAGREVSDFANTIRQAMGGDNSSVQNQRSFQMMLPLYMGENETSYPTYLSVYDENTTDKETGIEKKETWLRICVLTDNIGAAELIFRVYEKNQLDMRFYFSQGEVAEDFKDYISNLRLAVREQTNFQIGEIRLGSIGERMMLAQ